MVVNIMEKETKNKNKQTRTGHMVVRESVPR